MVYLGANACIIGRNIEKTEKVAADIATARKGAKVLAIACDVRDVRIAPCCTCWWVEMITNAILYRTRA